MYLNIFMPQFTVLNFAVLKSDFICFYIYISFWLLYLEANLTGSLPYDS